MALDHTTAAYAVVDAGPNMPRADALHILHGIGHNKLAPYRRSPRAGTGGNEMKFIKQVWRGAGHLPHVGTHPGTPILFILLAVGIAAGGFAGFLIMFAFFGGIYIFGAYARAQTSDEIERVRELEEKNLSQSNKGE